MKRSGNRIEGCVSDNFLVGDEIGSLFAGKLVQTPDGDWAFIAWRNVAPDGSFLGELSEPYPDTVDGAGNLRVDWQTSG